MSPMVEIEFRVYLCPLPDCDWVITSEPPGDAESEGALAGVFGWGVFSAHARSERLRRTEEDIRSHLKGHSVDEFAIALARANKRIAEMEGR